MSRNRSSHGIIATRIFRDVSWRARLLESDGARLSKMTATQVESRKLQTFLETGVALAGTLELKRAVTRVLEGLGRHHGMIRSALTLLDSETRELEIVASHGLDENGARRVRYKLGEGITGRVVQTGKPIVVPQVSREPMFLDRLGVRKKVPGR